MKVRKNGHNTLGLNFEYVLDILLDSFVKERKKERKSKRKKEEKQGNNNKKRKKREESCVIEIKRR